jgi:hypothetical protein
VARKRRVLLPKQLRAGGVRNAVRLLYPKLARSLPWVTGLPDCTIWHRVVGYYLGAAQASVAPFLGKPKALAANRAQGQGIDYFALKSIAGPLPRLTCPHGGRTTQMRRPGGSLTQRTVFSTNWQCDWSAEKCWQAPLAHGAEKRKTSAGATGCAMASSSGVSEFARLLGRACHSGADVVG